jgi:hypothetical protein
MTIKYMTDGVRWGVKARITPVEIEKETSTSVWPVGQGRRAKVSDSDIFHDTWEDAHTYLMESADNHVHNAQMQLERAKGAQGNVKGMKKPVEP